MSDSSENLVPGSSDVFTCKGHRHDRASASDMIPMTNGLAVLCAVIDTSVHSAFLSWFRDLLRF